MVVLTAIQNTVEINSPFVTSMGLLMYLVLQVAYQLIMFGLQILPFISLIYTAYLLIRTLRKPKKNYKMHAPEKKFLVFIPAHNEENVVQQLIDNLLNQMKYPKELYDVYVIADNCSDNTAALSRAAGANVIEHFSAPDEPKGKPYGIKYAIDQIGDALLDYDFVAIFDADNLVSANFFQEMNSQVLSDPRIKVSQGYLDSKNVDSSPVALGYSLAYYMSNRFFCYARGEIGMSPVIGGTGFIMDTQVLDEIGWTVNSLTEDLEFQMQCVEHGYKIEWNHFAPIYDEKPTGYKQSVVQRVRWARGHWTVRKRYFKKLLKNIWGSYFNEGKVDLVTLDAAFYVIMPLGVAASPIIFIASVTREPIKAVAMLGMALIMICGSIVLANYAMKQDSNQRSNSSFLRQLFGMVWYLTSAMFIYLYGILTYTENVWVRTEHNVDTSMEDLLAIIE